RLAQSVLREERPLADHGPGTELEQALVRGLDDDLSLDDDVQAGAGRATFGQDLSRPERQLGTGGLELFEIVVVHWREYRTDAYRRAARRTRSACSVSSSLGPEPQSTASTLLPFEPGAFHHLPPARHRPSGRRRSSSRSRASLARGSPASPIRAST